MTVVPDNAALCDCWAKASAEEREVAYVGRNRGMFAPKGLRDCERCHGAGFWVPERPRSRLSDSLLRDGFPNLPLVYLQHDGGSLLGTVRVSQVEITTGMTDERGFSALLHARLMSTLGDMAAVMRAPTFPVHDEAAPK